MKVIWYFKAANKSNQTAFWIIYLVCPVRRNMDLVERKKTYEIRIKSGTVQELVCYWLSDIYCIMLEVLHVSHMKAMSWVLQITWNWTITSNLSVMFLGSDKMYVNLKLTENWVNVLLFYIIKLKKWNTGVNTEKWIQGSV